MSVFDKKTKIAQNTAAKRVKLPVGSRFGRNRGDDLTPPLQTKGGSHPVLQLLQMKNNRVVVQENKNRIGV